MDFESIPHKDIRSVQEVPAVQRELSEEELALISEQASDQVLLDIYINSLKDIQRDKDSELRRACDYVDEAIKGLNAYVAAISPKIWGQGTQGLSYMVNVEVNRFTGKLRSIYSQLVASEPSVARYDDLLIELRKAYHDIAGAMYVSISYFLNSLSEIDANEVKILVEPLSILARRGSFDSLEHSLLEKLLPVNLMKQAIDFRKNHPNPAKAEVLRILDIVQTFASFSQLGYRLRSEPGGQPQIRFLSSISYAGLEATAADVKENMAYLEGETNKRRIRMEEIVTAVTAQP